MNGAGATFDTEPQAPSGLCTIRTRLRPGAGGHTYNIASNGLLRFRLTFGQEAFTPSALVLRLVRLSACVSQSVSQQVICAQLASEDTWDFAWVMNLGHPVPRLTRHLASWQGLAVWGRAETQIRPPVPSPVNASLSETVSESMGGPFSRARWLWAAQFTPRLPDTGPPSFSPPVALFRFRSFLLLTIDESRHTGFGPIPERESSLRTGIAPLATTRRRRSSSLHVLYALRAVQGDDSRVPRVHKHRTVAPNTCLPPRTEQDCRGPKRTPVRTPYRARSIDTWRQSQTRIHPPTALGTKSTLTRGPTVARLALHPPRPNQPTGQPSGRRLGSKVRGWDTAYPVGVSVGPHPSPSWACLSSVSGIDCTPPSTRSSQFQSWTLMLTFPRPGITPRPNPNYGVRSSITGTGKEPPTHCLLPAAHASKSTSSTHPPASFLPCLLRLPLPLPLPLRLPLACACACIWVCACTCAAGVASSPPRTLLRSRLFLASC
ncbi:hypothetical protein X797_003562 [Metarhizium robertsii]|uniref:Uncharacterized protein n=1 Tax=Metarhizium robertsii TaxID=568076 RepID=A0A0A1V2F5_9HYPO|nr:hypothetical protein X797_003562 [Metarhizium robertsii]